MNRLVLISLASVVALVAIALSASTAAVAQQNQPVTCVKRTATAKPPPFPAGPRPQPRGEKRPGQPDVAEHQPLLKPLCPEGEVLVVKNFAGSRAIHSLRQRGDPTCRYNEKSSATSATSMVRGADTNHRRRTPPHRRATASGATRLASTMAPPLSTVPPTAAA